MASNSKDDPANRRQRRYRDDRPEDDTDNPPLDSLRSLHEAMFSDVNRTVNPPSHLFGSYSLRDQLPFGGDNTSPHSQSDSLLSLRDILDDALAIVNSSDLHVSEFHRNQQGLQQQLQPRQTRPRSAPPVTGGRNLRGNHHHSPSPGSGGSNHSDGTRSVD